MWSEWKTIRFYIIILVPIAIALAALTGEILLTAIYMAGIFMIAILFDIIIPRMILWLEGRNWREYYQGDFYYPLEINPIKIRMRPPLIPLDGMFDENI